MRVSAVQNNPNFQKLEIRNKGYYHYKDASISKFKEKLADTEFVDVIIDSHGLAIKEKMAEVLKRIQSFSLFPLENAVSVNFIGEKEPLYKFSYNSLEEARKVWRMLADSDKGKDSSIDMYATATLWIDQNLKKKYN